jgi:hypothetical protein
MTPETFSAIVGIARLSVTLDLVWSGPGTVRRSFALCDWRARADSAALANCRPCHFRRRRRHSEHGLRNDRGHGDPDGRVHEREREGSLRPSSRAPRWCSGSRTSTPTVFPTASSSGDDWLSRRGRDRPSGARDPARGRGAHRCLDAGAVGLLRASTSVWLALGIGLATLAAEGVRYGRLEGLRACGNAARGRRQPGLGSHIVALKVPLAHGLP